jgi:hypothetical protein
MKTVHVNPAFNTALSVIQDMGKTPWLVVDGTKASALPFENRTTARNAKSFLNLTGSVVKATECTFIINATEVKETKKAAFIKLVQASLVVTGTSFALSSMKCL